MKVSKRHLLNYSILIPYLILSVIGLLVVYSTTSTSLIQVGGNPFASVINQGLFWGLSLLAITFIYRLKLTFLRSANTMVFVMGIEILLLIIARFFSKEINGAHGWISAGPITFQPAEYLKLIVIWMMALTFARRQREVAMYDYQALSRGHLFPRQLQDWRVYLAVMVGLVVIQPDLGNATIIILTLFIMCCVTGVAYRWFSTGLAFIAGGATLFLGFIGMVGADRMAKVPVFGYVAKRFKAFYNPFKDASDSGHQLINSYYAMSNGGWFGRGLGNSIEKKGYLPEATTDFVFSIVIEELGLIGAGLILALMFFLILRIFLVGIKAKDAFNAMIALGVGSLLLVQVFVNIGGISGLIPSTGVTFPFLSQGGNSLLTISVAIGLVLNIDANEKRQVIEEEVEEELNELRFSFDDEL
ncbi:cell division peptidoglycan polymerase FtsW [Streptococcus sp. DD12]|uniref:cell division peptidoglycan polymerase FtsW n=1 Tax=Streptococcus sp. DD12 TaxID=1777880 RepID=UPI00079C3842|nr:FtsW/RodA/SpoVE family cell cycle protein [Streptococcus sp. DD12]KXT76613.1 Cell division protein FtsW [Streptococcus sp. DD12]